MTQFEALSLALELSITAPTDELSQLTSKMAQEFSHGLDEFTIARAKKEVLDKLKTNLNRD